MDALDQRLGQSTVNACEACFGAQIEAEHVQLQQTRKEFEGDRTVVVFPLTRHSKKSPEDTGAALGEWLVAHDELVSAYQVVKGFLNLTIVPRLLDVTIAAGSLPMRPLAFSQQEASPR